MLQYIQKFDRSGTNRFTFSILIPSWNNLPYLQLCIGSIRKHSFYDHQIIVLVNEGKDNTLEWLDQQKNVDYVHAGKNIGICYGLNSCRSLIKSDYVVYANDDMYLLPNWDKVLKEEIDRIGHKQFMLSCTMIEPRSTGNNCVVVNDFGDSLENFKEKELLEAHSKLVRNDWNGSTWPPNVMHIDQWDLVGGMSVEFSPGMYSDPDLSKKLWDSGVRHFVGKGNSLVYHFGSKSTKRVKKNKGRKTFLSKWGISAGDFMKNYLRTGTPVAAKLSDPTTSTLQNVIRKFKRIRNEL